MGSSMQTRTTALPIVTCDLDRIQMDTALHATRNSAPVSCAEGMVDRRADARSPGVNRSYSQELVHFLCLADSTG